MSLTFDESGVEIGEVEPIDSLVPVSDLPQGEYVQAHVILRMVNDFKGTVQTLGQFSGALDSISQSVQDIPPWLLFGGAAVAAMMLINKRGIDGGD